RSGITTFRQIVKYFPKSPEMPLLSKQMSDEFAKLFLDGGAQSLPPLVALALYYDYRELTPVGPEGDEIISKLADRLVSVDLLNRAADLLEHQSQYRLRGEDRARTGARLAVVYLLDRNPDGALKALQTTNAQNLSAPVQQERRLLEARALGDLERFPEALNLLGQDQSADAGALRAELHWRNKDWLAFARVAGLTLNNRASDPAPLTVDERKLVLQLAVAYALSNDTASLDRLRRSYEARFRDTSDADTFSAIVTSVSRNAGDPRQLAATIAQVGQYEAFMSRYRERVAKGGLSAIN
ncbi:MAG: tetratricopeptide repeat protein, partial [Ferrovibrio sp.]